jgi:hypothetical protein
MTAGAHIPTAIAHHRTEKNAVSITSLSAVPEPSGVGAQIAEVKRRLSKLSPVDQHGEYDELFADLVALEAYRRSLMSPCFEFDTGDRVVTVTAKFLTPAEAQHLLRLNTRNRTMRPSDVDAMAADIRDGEWLFTGDTIKLARGDDGEFLADAQHRLAAIAKGDIAVPVIIVDNLNPDVTETIDQGRPRKVGDILRMSYGHQSIKNESIIAAIASLELLLNNPGKSFNRKAIAQYAHQHFDTFSDWAHWAKAVAADSERVAVAGMRFVAAIAPAPLSVLAAHMTSSGADVEIVKEFFGRVASGMVSDSDRTNIIPLLRRRQKSGNTLSRVTGGGSATAPLLVEFAVYISAFNRWVRNEQVERIQSSTKYRPKSLAELPEVVLSGRTDV